MNYVLLIVPPLAFVMLALLALLNGCVQASPARPPANVAEENKLAEVLTAALARGDRVKATPRGDFYWRWVTTGERWNFEQWHYEVVK